MSVAHEWDCRGSRKGHKNKHSQWSCPPPAHPNLLQRTHHVFQKLCCLPVIQLILLNVLLTHKTSLTCRTPAPSEAHHLALPHRAKHWTWGYFLGFWAHPLKLCTYMTPLICPHSKEAKTHYFSIAFNVWLLLLHYLFMLYCCNFILFNVCSLDCWNAPRKVNALLFINMLICPKTKNTFQLKYKAREHFIKISQCWTFFVCGPE